MNGPSLSDRSSTSLRQILKRTAHQLLIGSMFGIGLTGCTTLQEYCNNCFKVGPNYGKSPAPVEKKWIDQGSQRLKPGTENLEKWWTVFKDPMLDWLICTASKQNLTLREAGFRILTARAELGFTAGLLFPQQQSFDASYTRKEVSIQVANRNATPQRFFSNLAQGFSITWELDFWGKYRRLIESMNDHLDATVEDYDAVLVMLLGDVAKAYTQLRIAQKQLELVKTNILLQKETLAIATSRFKGGLTTELDVDQATSTLYQTEAIIPQLEIQARMACNLLCVLMGLPPEELESKLGGGGIPTAPPEVAVGIPCEVLMNRPDVRKAEREAAEICARIGSAEADLYPHISIVGTIGTAAQTFPTLFTTQAWYGSIGPAFQWDILNYGRIVNHVAMEDARFQEKVVAFQNMVLKANEESENSIISFLKSQERVIALNKSVEADIKAVKVALAQYNAGTVDFNRVSLLEQNLVSEQDALAQSQGDIALALIELYRSLGGGWEIRLQECNQQMPPAAPPAAAPDISSFIPKPKSDKDYSDKYSIDENDDSDKKKDDSDKSKDDADKKNKSDKDKISTQAKSNKYQIERNASNPATTSSAVLQPSIKNPPQTLPTANNSSSVLPVSSNLGITPGQSSSSK